MSNKYLDYNGLNRVLNTIKKWIAKSKLTDEDVLEAVVRTDFCFPIADNNNELFLSEKMEVYIL